MLFDQAEYNIRCEWGEKGAALLAPISDVVIVVDIFSFSTSVEIAVCQDARVYPYRWKDESVYEYARSVMAEVADKRNSNGYCLSPASLQNLSPNIRLVLPSPNGSTICLATGLTPTLAGCLRNCRSVAEYAMKKGKNIAVIPAGEKWEDGALRPCLEDFVGAGAIIQYLRGTLSPEARLAVAAFEQTSSNLQNSLASCGSGKEKISKGLERDITLAAELNVSNCVPLLEDGVFTR